MNKFEIASWKDIDEIVEGSVNLPFTCIDGETIMNNTGYYYVINTKRGDSVAIDVSKGTNEKTGKPNFSIHLDAIGMFEDDTQETWFATKGKSKKELRKLIQRIILSYVIWEDICSDESEDL